MASYLQRARGSGGTVHREVRSSTRDARPSVAAVVHQQRRRRRRAEPSQRLHHAGSIAVAHHPPTRCAFTVVACGTVVVQWSHIRPIHLPACLRTCALCSCVVGSPNSSLHSSVRLCARLCSDQPSRQPFQPVESAAACRWISPAASTNEPTNSGTRWDRSCHYDDIDTRMANTSWQLERGGEGRRAQATHSACHCPLQSDSVGPPAHSHSH